MNEICELQFDFISDKKYSIWVTNFTGMMIFAHTLINPWRIVRVSSETHDGVVIASSYDGFTSVVQAAANGRTV